MALTMYYSKERPKEEKETTYQEDRIKVEDVQICNLPREYFLGNPPNPISDELEMAVLTESAGKSFRKEITNK